MPSMHLWKKILIVTVFCRNLPRTGMTRNLQWHWIQPESGMEYLHQLHFPLSFIFYFPFSFFIQAKIKRSIGGDPRSQGSRLEGKRRSAADMTVVTEWKRWWIWLTLWVTFLVINAWPFQLYRLHVFFWLRLCVVIYLSLFVNIIVMSDQC